MRFKNQHKTLALIVAFGAFFLTAPAFAGKAKKTKRVTKPAVKAAITQQLTKMVGNQVHLHVEVLSLIHI